MYFMQRFPHLHLDIPSERRACDARSHSIQSGLLIFLSNQEVFWYVLQQERPRIDIPYTCGRFEDIVTE